MDLNVEKNKLWVMRDPWNDGCYMGSPPKIFVPIEDAVKFSSKEKAQIWVEKAVALSNKYAYPWRPIILEDAFILEVMGS